jgi:peptidoglycan/LPS O-acetylase OafA/YrhL
MSNESTVSNAPKPAQGRLDSLEALRGVAALIVVLHHVCGTMALPKTFGRDLFGGIFTPGQFGVDVFFVLSGFIIFYTNSREGLGLDGVRRYSLRRFFRIFPVYWLICLFYIPMVYLNPSVGPASLERSLPELLHSIFLLPYGKDPVLGPAWSLCFEMMFYIVFIPFLFSRRLGWWVWTIWLVGVAVVHFAKLEFSSPFLTQFFSELVLQFFLGMIVAMLVRRSATARFMPWVLLGTAILVAMLLLEWRQGKDAVPYRHLIYGTGSAVLIYGLACGDIIKGWAIPPFWRMIGLYSYSIYLVHRPVQQAMVKFSQKLLGVGHAEWVLYGVCLVIAACSVWFGIILGRYFEQPVLEFCKKRIVR